MKKYKVEYGKCKVSYGEDTLRKVAARYGVYDVQDARDCMAVAVRHFCETHFMYAFSARLDGIDAATRGCLWQSWQYQPNGTFKGWINTGMK